MNELVILNRLLFLGGLCLLVKVWPYVGGAMQWEVDLMW